VRTRNENMKTRLILYLAKFMTVIALGLTKTADGLLWVSALVLKFTVELILKI